MKVKYVFGIFDFGEITPVKKVIKKFSINPKQKLGI